MSKEFDFRCCWTCQHCYLDICKGCKGFGCDAPGGILFALAIPDGSNINYELHKSRANCKAYKRG